MMESMELKVRKIFKDNVSTSVSFQDFAVDRLLEDAGVNSIELIKIIIALEKEFDVVFPDDLDYSEFITLGDFLRYLEKMIH